MNEVTISVRRGEPFRALLVVLLAWVTVRVIWQGFFPAAQSLTLPIARQIEMVSRDELMVKSSSLPSLLIVDISSMSAVSDVSSRSRAGRLSTGLNIDVQKTPQRPSVQQLISFPAAMDRSESNEPKRIAPSVLPRLTADRRESNIFAPKSDAFSGYFWLFARQGNSPKRWRAGSPASQFPVAQYGASQAGAILTYRISGDNNRNISTFARASTALSTKSQEELAIGIKSKPIRNVPFTFFAEQRFGARKDSNRGTAIYLAGGTGPDLVLPDTSLETYGQMGFIFARDDSYFFDASAALQKQVVEREGHKITAGAGIWASGQEGATRVDIGPRVKLHVPVGQVNVQVSIDWRERIGGNAHPGSGASVTLSTGF